MEQNKVQAGPTKEFFIQMLTRDIKLEKAIIDLLDNSVDGAKNLRPDKNFIGLEVDIEINETGFTIIDNCGGFSLKTAKEYAFMFGRPTNAENDVKNSVGRFGVGMKRALFKIGQRFEVESKHNKDHFQVDVDVNEWSTKPDEWTFDYKINTDEDEDIKTDGTYIHVSDLYLDVSDEFGSSNFISGLREEIESTLNFSLNQGLTIKLNNQILKKKDLSFFENDQLKPYYEENNVDEVNIKVFAGIGKPDPNLAGWYIYCNDRLVLSSDKTFITGWDGRKFGEMGVKYHNIYAMFRGVVFFSSEDAKKLPMTTTKTGIDSNSVVFKAARATMVKSMGQVISFLKTINTDDDRADIATSSKEIDVIQLKDAVYSKKFIYPVILGESDNSVSISFKVDRDMANSLKGYFAVSSYRDCGNKLLEYFLKFEQDNL